MHTSLSSPIHHHHAHFTPQVSVNGTRPVPLHIRVPDWATGAEVTINGKAPAAQ